MIEIDNREHQLIELLRKHDTQPEATHLKIAALEIGDVVLCNKVIIERKSVADLYASILDGRYEEQSYRLANLGPAFPNHHIIYLIEGDIHRHKHKAMLMSAIFSINYYKGFSVMRTMHLQETADFIWNTFKKITKETNKRGFYELTPASLSSPPPTPELASTETNETTEPSAVTTASPSATEKDYVSVVKKCKKENITENNIDEIMLCQIPGISTQSALAIVKQVGSIRQLLEQYAKEGDAVFAGIKVANSTNGKETKLSKTIVQNIKRFLFKVEGATELFTKKPTGGGKRKAEAKTTTLGTELETEPENIDAL